MESSAWTNCDHIQKKEDVYVWFDHACTYSTCLFVLSLHWPLKSKNRTLFIETYRNWPSLCPHLRAWLTLLTRCEISPVVSVSSTNCTPWPSWISVTWEKDVCADANQIRPSILLFLDALMMNLKEKKTLWAKTQWTRLLGINSSKLLETVWTWVNLVPNSLHMRIQEPQLAQLCQHLAIRSHPSRGDPQLGALNEHPKGSWASCIFDRFF